MMLKLLLLRHAKAVHSAQYDDIDRPLAPRGRDDAALVGSYIAAQGLNPGVALISSACRTRETWDIVKNFVGPVEPLFEEALYHASAEGMLKRLREMKGEAQTVLMVGHNPSIAYLANLLAGSGPEAERREMQTKFPTCALVVLTCDVGSWHDLSAGRAALDAFVYPKLLGGPE